MEIDATTPAAPIALGDGASTPGVRSSHAGEFAKVYELADARRRRMTGPDRIPEQVWDEIQRAHELAGELAARGQRVAFETHRLTGQVVASLCDNDGNVVRGMGLREVVGIGPDPGSAA